MREAASCQINVQRGESMLAIEEQQGTEAAKAVADEARVVGDEYANGYGTHRTKVEDSQYSRRASAWREAAEKVVDAEAGAEKVAIVAAPLSMQAVVENRELQLSAIRDTERGVRAEG